MAIGAAGLAPGRCKLYRPHSGSRPYLQYPLSYNQSVYHYMGQVLRNGGLPYADFVDIKGPVGLLAYALPGILIGPSDIAYRVFDLFVMLEAGVLLFLFAKKLLPKKELAFAVVALWFSHAIVDGPSNTGDVTNLIVLSVLGAATAPAALAGLLFFGAVFVKPTAAIPFGLVVITRLKSGSFLLRFLGGSIAPTIALMSLFYLAGALTPMWQAHFKDAVLWHLPSDQYFWERTRLGFAEWVEFDLWFRLGGLIGLLFLGRSLPAWQARLATVGAIVAVLIENRYYPYHFSPVLPFLAIGTVQLAWKLAAQVEKLPKLLGSRVVITTVAILPLLVLPLKQVIGHRGTDYLLYRDTVQLLSQRHQTADYLSSHIQPSESLYVLGDVGLYNSLGKITSCRFANPAMVLHGFSFESAPCHRIQWRQEILRFLWTSKPDWLVVNQALQGSLDPDFAKSVDELLRGDYALDATVLQDQVFLKIK